jgi:hypothetical protein
MHRLARAWFEEHGFFAGKKLLHDTFAAVRSAPR